MCHALRHEDMTCSLFQNYYLERMAAVSPVKRKHLSKEVKERGSLLLALLVPQQSARSLCYYLLLGQMAHHKGQSR